MIRPRILQLLVFIMFVIPVSGRPDSVHGKSSLEKVRRLFYQSVEAPDSINRAMILLSEIAWDEVREGLALTYQGALTTLKGKFAKMPLRKYRLVMDGLSLMDQGIEKSAGNIEARFVRGMTCFYLPFFFDRKQTAREDFRVIVQLMDRYYPDYPEDLIRNVIDFLLENAGLTEEETERILRIRSALKPDEQ